MSQQVKKPRKSGVRPKYGSPGNVRLALSHDVCALRRAVFLGKPSVILIGGKEVAVIPDCDRQRLERLLEQEAEEKELDRLDVEEAERRLDDPTEVSIPFEQALREIELGHVSD